MLRAIAISARTTPAAGARRCVAGAQWQFARHLADKTILPGTQSKTVSPAGVGLPPSLSPSSPATPATPSHGSIIPPENVPKVPPPPSQVQTAPPTSIPSTRPPNPVVSAPVPPSPPPPPPPKKRRTFRRLLLFLILASGLGYGGGVYYSLVNDNFHDFFTEYIPYGEETVLYFEEREFRRRFPDGSSGPSRLHHQTRGENKLTISSKSGVSAKVTEDKKGGDLVKDGKKVSATNVDTSKKAAAVSSAKAQSSDKTQSSDKSKAKSAESAEQGKSRTSTGTPVPSKASEARESPAKAKPQKKDVAKAETQKKGVVEVPKAPTSIIRLDPLNVENAADPMVQGLTKILNDIIAVVNADSAADKYSTTMAKAKDDLKKLASEVSDHRATETKKAADTIKLQEAEFEQGAQELIRRIETQMKDQELQWREEYEAERKKIADNYEQRLKAELEAAQKVADQRLRNSLIEQDIKLRGDFTTSVKDRIETERSGRLSKLDELSTSVSELENLTASWNEVVESNLKTQHLVVAAESVRSVLESTDRPKPFIHELAALKEIASDDAVVNAAIASINPSAYQRGIPTSAQLIDRFRRVSAEVRKAALLPEDAGVASHIASFMLSRVMFQKKGIAVGDDVESVLTRTETYLEEGNLDDAAREMNGLTGWAKLLCKDWLGDCRTVLEVRQALDVIATEARLQSLMVQ